MQNFNVDTEQNIELEYPIASIGERMLAYLIDILILILYGILMFILVINTVGKDVDEDTLTVYIIIAYIPGLLYHFVMETLNKGQSVGKWLMRTQVVMVDGSRPPISAYLLRWIFRLVDMTFYGIVAIISYVMSDKGQRVGDRLANTTVIKLKKVQSWASRQQFQLDTNYNVKYPEAAKLRDEHIALIGDVIALPVGPKKYELAGRVRGKVEDYLNIKGQPDDVAFLRTLVKDYYQYYLRAEENDRLN